MPRQRRRPDPASRPDPYELAVQRAAEEPGPEDQEGAPPLPRLQAGPFRVGPTGLLVGVVLLVLVGGFVRFDADRTPELAASCTEHGIALSAERVRPGGLVQYTVVGPPGEVALSVNPVRTAGGAPSADQVVPPVTVPDGCRTSGRFGAQVPPGDHLVSVLVGGEPVATAELTVTQEGDPDAG